jgi:cytochrome b subunit of formate dehydrogenase
MMFRIITIYSVSILLVLLVLHRVAIAFLAGKVTAQRGCKTFVGRILCFFLTASFVLLAITAFVPVLRQHPLQDTMLQLHVAGAGVFVFFLALATLRWAGAARFVPEDGPWLKALMGCRCRKSRDALPPAARFHAWRKIFFWLGSFLGLACLMTALLTMFPILSSDGIATCLLVHSYFALALLLLVIVQIYTWLIVKKV